MKYKIPAAIISVLAIGGAYLNFHEEPEPEPAPIEEKKFEQPKPIQGFGIIDLEQIKNVHPDGEELAELSAQEKRLRLELDALLIPYQKPKDKETPEIDEKPFDESAYDRNMQSFISQLADLKAKRTQLTEKYTRESRAEYIRRRDEVHSFYFNRALNITLKLQNADNLGLTDEEIKNLQVELDDIVAERNQKQGEMLAQWTAEINERVEKEIAPEEERIKKESQETLEKSRADAERKVQELQERNKNLIETATKEIEARQTRRKEILAELEDIVKKRIELENKILDSIVDETGKLAAFHRLETVFIKSDYTTDDKFDLNKYDFNIKKSPGAKIYASKNTPDLTQDLIKALEIKKE